MDRSCGKYKPAKSKNGNSKLKRVIRKKPPSDSSYIKLKAITYLENESLNLKVDLSNDFPKIVQQQADDLMETVQFIDAGDGKTTIISSMTGWGKGEEWDKAYNFFVTGNEWKYNKFLSNFNAGLKSKVVELAQWLYLMCIVDKLRYIIMQLF